jgi:hypothetical protein
VEIPEQLALAVDEAVGRTLRAELDARGLLLTQTDAAAASAAAAQSGAALLRRAIMQCYPGRVLAQPVRPGEPAVEIAFDDDHTAARIAAALAFGASTARLLVAPRPAGRAEAAGQVDLLCAVFNLGIGLVDGLATGSRVSGWGSSAYSSPWT